VCGRYVILCDGLLIVCSQQTGARRPSSSTMPGPSALSHSSSGELRSGIRQHAVRLLQNYKQYVFELTAEMYVLELSAEMFASLLAELFTSRKDIFSFKVPVLICCCAMSLNKGILSWKTSVFRGSGFILKDLLRY
jgi:hypothetical protein